MTSLNWLAFSSWPVAWTVSAVRGPYSTPVGMLTFCAMTARRDVLERDAARRELAGIELQAHGVLLRAVHQHLRHAADHRQALRQRRLAELVERRERHLVDVSASVRIGASAGFVFWYDGGMIPCGRLRPSARSPPERPARPRRCSGRARTG